MSGSDAYWPVALKNRSDESIGAKGSQPHLNYQNNHRVRDRKGREPLRFSRTGNPGALKSIAADDVQTSWDTEQQSEREHLHLRSMSARNSGDDEDVHSRDAGVEERVAKAPRTSVGRSASEGRSNVSPR